MPRRLDIYAPTIGIPRRGERRADSNVETYVAMQIKIDNWRWAGVSFYFRAGKHMSQRLTEIAIRFKQAPYTAGVTR